MRSAENGLPIELTPAEAHTGATLHDIQLSYERAKAIFAHIIREKNSALPRTYAVWYAYVRGVPNELVTQIDACRHTSGAVTDEQCAFAYDRFLAPVRESDVDNVFATLFESLRRIVGSIAHSEHGVRQFSAELVEAEAGFHDNCSIESILSILRRLALAAKDARARNTALSALLEASRADVDTSRAALASMRAESRTDSLTGLSNRRHLENALSEAVEGDVRPLSLAVFDIDHFKRFNDTFGHVTGDQVLKLVAAILKDCASGRIVARHGGEEFALLCAGDGREIAVELAERARRLVMAQKLKKKSTGEPLGYITMSAGVAQFKPGDTMQSLIARADERLYVAKHAGRNRVLSDGGR
jgi:diguanylate cyclase